MCFLRKFGASMEFIWSNKRLLREELYVYCIYRIWYFSRVCVAQSEKRRSGHVKLRGLENKWNQPAKNRYGKRSCSSVVIRCGGGICEVFPFILKRICLCEKLLWKKFQVYREFLYFFLFFVKSFWCRTDIFFILDLCRICIGIFYTYVFLCFTQTLLLPAHDKMEILGWRF